MHNAHSDPSVIPDAFLWHSPRLWHTYCRALYPGLLRAPVHATVNHPTPEFLRVMHQPIPVHIISHNNPTFLHQMVRFLRCYGANITVLDNGSTLPRALAVLDFLSSFANVQRHHNKGPHGFFARDTIAAAPKFFAVTDPDLRPNPDTPPNFLAYLANLTQVRRARIECGDAKRIEGAAWACY